MPHLIYKLIHIRESLGYSKAETRNAEKNPNAYHTCPGNRQFSTVAKRSGPYRYKSYLLALWDTQLQVCPFPRHGHLKHEKFMKIKWLNTYKMLQTDLINMSYHYHRCKHFLTFHSALLNRLHWHPILLPKNNSLGLSLKSFQKKGGRETELSYNMVRVQIATIFLNGKLEICIKNLKT